jgi:uncharacterized phage protein (TIGR02216 family)
MMPDKFPWARLMQLGLGTLRLPPEQFWRATLREVMTPFMPREGNFERQTLDQLMQQWPDT